MGGIFSCNSIKRAKFNVIHQKYSAPNIPSLLIKNGYFVNKLNVFIHGL